MTIIPSFWTSNAERFFGAPSGFANECNFTLAVAFRDTCVDAQQGRTIDFSLPRETPKPYWLLAAAYAMIPFVELGMAARIDVENKRASDGGTHPHVHVYLAQRLLEADGFGLKCRWWDRYFLRDGGRYARAVVAAQLTAACNQLGIAARVAADQREEGDGTPLPRLASATFREFGRSGPSRRVPALLRRRSGCARTIDVNADGANRLESPITADSGSSVRLVNKLASLADQPGYCVVSEGAAGLTILSPSGIGFGFDGRAFRFEEIVAPTAGCTLSLISKLDWPALVVEGTGAFADAIALAGTIVGLAMINRCPGKEALRRIARHGVERLIAATSEYDPLRKIAASVPTAPILPDLEVTPEQVPIKAEEPKDTDLFDRYLPR